MNEIEMIVARMLLRLVEGAASALRPVAEGSLKPSDARAAERLAAALREVATAAKNLSTVPDAPGSARASPPAKVADAKGSEERRRGRKPMLIEHQGERRAAKDWAVLFKTSKAVIHSRRLRGVPIDGSVSRRGRRETPATAGAVRPQQPAASTARPAALPGAASKPAPMNGHAKRRASPCVAPAARTADRDAPIVNVLFDPVPVSSDILTLSASSIIEARGKRQTIAAWSRECDVPVAAVLGRLRQGRPIEFALEPVRR